jgi:hypothetical protein
MVWDGRRARDKRREMNSSKEIGRLGWSYGSDSRKGRGNQGAGQIHHGRLNAGMAVGTSGGIGCGLVVME